jgi:prophage antirepressor-like protein
LGLSNSAKALADLRKKKEGITSSYPLQTNGGIQNISIISEQGLYLLIMQSRKPNAVEFQLWVTGEVLPSIRKNGIYATGNTIDRILDDPDFGIELLQKLKRERAEKEKAENKVKDLEIVIDLNKDYATIKLVSSKTKQQFNWRPLKSYSEKNGIEIRKAMDVNYGEVNSYHKDVWEAVYGVNIKEVV